MKRSHLTFAAIALAATTVAHQPQVKAQSNIAAMRAIPNSSSFSWHSVLVRNVSPRMMAWWIDPAHQKEPVEIAASRQALELSNANRAKITQKQNDDVKLPAGVHQVVADDTYNTIHVLGTEAGTQKIAELVKMLDHTIPQVEIEAQFVSISAQDAKLLGIDLENAGKTGATGVEQQSPNMAIMRGDIQAKLQKLVAQNKAQVSFSPRITTTNNLAAVMYASADKTPAYISVKNDVGKMESISKNAQTDALRFDISHDLVVTTTPTINRNNTITIVLNLARATMLNVRDVAARKPTGEASAETPAESFPLKRPSSELVIAKIRDGETLAISGLSLDVLNLPTSKLQGTTAQTQNVIVFVTARIVKRTPEPEPGT